MDNKGFLLATNSLQLPKIPREPRLGWGLLFLPSPHRLLSGALPGLWEVEGGPAKGEYQRARTIPSAFLPELARNPGQEGGPKVSTFWVWRRGCGAPSETGASDPFRFLPPPLFAEGRAHGGRGSVLPALKLGSDSGKPQEVGEKNAVAPAGAGKAASGCKERSIYMPAAPRPHCAHQFTFNLFAFQPRCWLPGTVAGPPHPDLGPLVSSGCDPAAFIFICFLQDNSVGSFARLTLPWPGTHEPLLSALVRTGQYWAQRRQWLGLGAPEHSRGNSSCL